MGYTLPPNGVKNNAGAAASESTVRNNRGSIKTAGESSFETVRSTVNGGAMGFSEIQLGVEGVSGPTLGAEIGVLLSVGESSEGLVQVSVLHSLQKNDAVWFRAPEYGNIQSCRVARVINANNIVLNVPYTDDSVDAELYAVEEIGGERIVRPPVENMRQDKSHSVNAVRTRKTATAIRAGYWNESTGEFTTPPATSEDLASMGRNGENDSVTANSTVRLGLKSKATHKKQRGFTSTNDGTISGET